MITKINDILGQQMTRFLSKLIIGFAALGLIGFPSIVSTWMNYLMFGQELLSVRILNGVLLLFVLMLIHKNQI